MEVAKRNHTKLTPKQVRIIKSIPIYMVRQKDLAEIFGCSQFNINQIVNNKTWKDQ